MKNHAASAVLTLIVCSLFAANMGWRGIAIAVSSLLLLSFLLGYRPGASLLRAYWRLKWLYLSILLIYFGFSLDIIVEHGVWVMLAAFEKVMVLMLMLYGADCLLHSYDDKQLAGALYQLFKPLELVQLNVAVFAAGIVLVVRQVRESFSRRDKTAKQKLPFKQWLLSLEQRVFDKIIELDKREQRTSELVLHQAPLLSTATVLPLVLLLLFILLP